jgi:hypothetical protein
MEATWSGNGAAAGEEVIAQAGETTSFDGVVSAAPQDPLEERPELLLAAALVGGLLVAGLVSRIGR